MRRDIPSIIIGLGGIGSEIVEMVEKQMRNSAADVSKGIHKRRNVRFVIIDTDINSIRERENKGYRGASVRLSSNVSVSSCLEHDEGAKKDWFPNNTRYYKKSIAEGAGQIRAISRLALQRAIREGGLAPLYKVIEELHMWDGLLYEQELKIAVVTTIAGGTGSGIVLPLCIHIQDYLNRVYSGAHAKINAFLMLPDMLRDIIPSKKEKININANGYATIKELDAFKNNTSQKAPYINLPNEENMTLKRFEKSPLDFCFLFNKLSNKQGTYGDIQDCKAVVARCLYTQFLGTLAPEYFSREDNVLSSSLRRTHYHKAQFEIFASSGCAIVKYPYAEIREYLSLRWLLDILKNEWVKYDEERRKIMEAWQDLYFNDEDVKARSDAENFLDAVAEFDRRQKEANPSFETCEEKRKRHCQESAGLLEELENWIKGRIKAERYDLEGIVNDGYDEVKEGNIKGRERLRECLTQYIDCENDINQNNTDMFHKLAVSMGKEIAQPHSGNIQKYYIEYYIRDAEGVFENPNYIRFYLYWLESQLAGHKAELEEEISSTEENINDALKKVREIEGGEKRLKSVNIKKIIRERHDIYTKMLEQLQVKLEKYCIDVLLEYIRKVALKYEVFFREYSRILLLAKRRTDEMEIRFGQECLRMEHWVYSQKHHLEQMLSQMRLSRFYYSVGGEVSRWLYMENAEHRNERVQRDGAEKYEVIKMKWEEQYDKYFGRDFDMDVLTALREEARLEASSKGEIPYMIERLQTAKDSASFLLSTCRKPDNMVRNYCIFPPRLLEINDCGAVIKKFFDNGMAFADTDGLDVDERQIIFFEICYGLLAADIDFLTSEEGMCADYPEGSGDQSYDWVMRNLDKRHKGEEFTPHIDRRWNEKEHMEVDWDMPLFSVRVEKILWILFAEIIVCSLGNNEEELWKRFEECDGMKEAEIDERLEELVEELKKMNKMYKKDPNGEKDQFRTGMQNLFVEHWRHGKDDDVRKWVAEYVDEMTERFK